MERDSVEEMAACLFFKTSKKAYTVGKAQQHIDDSVKVCACYVATAESKLLVCHGNSVQCSCLGLRLPSVTFEDWCKGVFYFCFFETSPKVTTLVHLCVHAHTEQVQETVPESLITQHRNCNARYLAGCLGFSRDYNSIRKLLQNQV